MPSRFAVCAAAMLAFACSMAVAAAHEQTLTLREPIGHTWSDELVHRDVTIPQPNVAASSFTLADADGKAVPVQVEVLEGSPNAVSKARVWFKTTLPKGAELAFRLTYGDQGQAAAAPEGGASVRKQDGRLVLSTGVAEALLHDTVSFGGRPHEISDAPFLLGARPAATREWFGAVKADSKARVSDLETVVEADGPVWAQVCFAYKFADPEHAYTVTVRGTAGEPWIDVLESYRLPEGGRWTLTFADRLRPTEAFWMPWFIWKDGKVHGAYDLYRIPLAERAAAGKPFTTLRPKWTQHRDNAQLCIALGPGADDPPAVGALMTSPVDWVNPYDQFVPVTALDGGRGLAYAFPLGEGKRHWALLAGPAPRFDAKGKLQALMRRCADLPLDRFVNEWIFHWQRDPAKPAPHILTTWKRLQQIRADVAACLDTPAVRLIRRALEGDDKGDRKIAEFLAGQRDSLDAAVPNAGLYLARSYQDDFFNPTTYPRRLRAAMADLSAAGKPVGGPGSALIAYVFSDLNYWPGYANGWGVGNPNFHTDMYSKVLETAAMMPDHPHARRWMDFGMADLKDDMQRITFMPGGAGYECPGYHAYAFSHIVGMMSAVQNSGLGDPFQWPETKAAIRYLRHMHTPPDPRLGRRSLASIGDTHPWQGGTGLLFGQVAAGLKESNPDLATECMAVYRHYYGDQGSGDLVKDVLAVDQAIQPAPRDALDWAGREFPGFGAVLRSRFGTPHEAFASFKCGEARGHYQGDELSFHFHGAAMPISLDWHCGYHPRPDQEHMHNRVNLGDDENMDAAGRLLAFRTSDAADLAVGEVRSKRLRKMPKYAHQIVWQASYPRRELQREAHYRRYLMLVKHAGGSPLEDYLVIRDEIGADEPATFNLFVLARAGETRGRVHHFDGQLAADTEVFFAAPDRPKTVAIDRWSWPEQDSSSLIPEDFKVGEDRWRKGELQQWLRVTAEPGQAFLAVVYPHRKGTPAPEFESLAGGKGVRVALGDAREEIYLATEPAKGAGGQAVVRRGRQDAVVLKPGEVPAP